ncbi:transposase [Trichonephila inaurata madagascariensis]|uniref:Transposase n=1 Tax=Trichonephila inaurata madagascariensis TaxID=2747483 RepID=A0A8X6XRN0_9ARAC|nr:transposase [Trichonephila inaurata madagascariensis]
MKWQHTAIFDMEWSCECQIAASSLSFPAIFRNIFCCNLICQKYLNLGANELNEHNKENRLQIDYQHLARQRATHSHKQRFLYRIVTGDEKWCLNINMKKRKEWVAPGDTLRPRVKPDLLPKKIMICVW